MRQLPYANDAVPLAFVMPLEWDASLVTGVTLTVLSMGGVVLQAADDCTLYTSTTLKTSVTQYASSITLADTAAALNVGDTIRITGATGSELRRVKGYRARVVELDSVLDNAYDTGDVIQCHDVRYALDVSDTTVYPKGKMVQLLWTPTGSGQAVVETAQIAYTALDLVGLRGYVKDHFERAYDALTKPVDKFDRIAQRAEQLMSYELLAVGFDMQRIVDQDVIMPALAVKIALTWSLNGDEDHKDEHEMYANEYANRLRVLQALPIFVDQNQDNAINDAEITTHEHLFARGW